MRMDRYEENKNDIDSDENLSLSRTERHKEMYDNAYDNRSIVDLNNYLNVKEEDVDDNEEEIENEEIVYEEKNYDVNDYIKKAHERIEPDKELRNINNQEFLNQEDEISKLIASIDEQRESAEFFSDLLGDDENTMIEGQMTKEEFTQTTYEEFYATEVEGKKDDNTKLGKALTDETISKLELEESNEEFEDIIKTHGISKKRKRYLAITIFSVTLFMLIIVILIIIFK